MKTPFGKLAITSLSVTILVGLSGCDDKKSAENSNNGSTEAFSLNANEVAAIKAADGSPIESVIGLFASVIQARGQLQLGSNGASGNLKIEERFAKKLDEQFDIKCSALCEIKEREKSREQN